MSTFTWNRCPVSSGIRKQVRAELKADIEQIRADLRESELRLQKEITQAKVDLLKWLVPLMFAQVAAIAALVKLL